MGKKCELGKIKGRKRSYAKNNRDFLGKNNKLTKIKLY